jgi:hypothetical protein
LTKRRANDDRSVVPSASGAGFEQEEPNLVAADTGIEAQHVFHEGSELAEQFDAHESAADHDDRQAAAARRRLRRRIGALELLDDVVSAERSAAVPVVRSTPRTAAA